MTIISEKFEINKVINPAFTAYVLAQFLKDFDKKNSKKIENVYVFLVLPFCIYPEYRYLLNKSGTKNLILLVERNKELFNSFNKVLHYFLPYTYEGLYFLLKSNVIKIVDDKIIILPKSFKPNNHSKYIKNEIKASRQLATLLANKFDTVTVFKSLGIEL